MESRKKHGTLGRLRGRVALLTAILVGAVLVSTAVAIFVGYRATRAASIQDAANLTRLLLEQMDQVFMAVESAARDTADRLRESKGRVPSEKQVTEWLKDSSTPVQGILFVFLLHPDGRLIASSNPEFFDGMRGDFSALRLAHHAEEKGVLHVGQVNDSLGHGRRFIPVSRRITDATGRELAIAGTALDPHYFQQVFSELATDGDTRLNIRLRDGTIMLRYPHREELIGRNFMTVQKVYEAVDRFERGHLIDHSPIENDQAFYYFQRSADFPYFVLLVRNLERMYGEWRSLAWQKIILSVFICLLLTGFSWVLQRQLRRLEQEEESIRQLEESTRATSRLEAIGRLAGGIARDFNSVLMVIFGQVEWIENRLPAENTAAFEAVQKMKKALNRARDLVRQVLAFSRLNPDAKGPVDVASMVDEIGVFLRSGLPAGIMLEIAPGGSGTIQGDGIQIYQVILNLCSNAIDSMKARGGTLKMAVKTEGPDVLLSVEDTGEGIPEENLKKIFEPFFTTKPVGEGTGVGLSMVRKILVDHGARIEVESELGRGTRMRIHFPALLVAPQALPAHERVLFVDDEEAVVTLVRDYFENQRVPALCLTDGKKALEILSRDDHGVGLLIADREMESVSAEELLRVGRRGHPLLKGVLTTETGEKTAEEVGETVYLKKPYGFQELQQAINRVRPVSRA